MDDNLAIFTPRLGECSETFIRRHVRDLLPGRTVVMAHSQSENRYWQIDCPAIVLTDLVVAGQGKKEIEHSVMEFLRMHRVSVALAEWLDFGLSVMPLCKKLKIPLFAHAHGYDVSQQRLRTPIWQGLYRKYNKCMGVITMSEHSRKQLIGIGLKPEKVFVVPYGVQVPEITPRPQNSGVRCLAVGRMVPKKGPVFTLEAFRLALEKSPVLSLDMVGDGILYDVAQDYIAFHGLEENVTLHGPLPHDEVMALLRQADIFVQHSLTDLVTGNQEGLPVSILEAMAFALPVISTVHAGIPEAVMDGVTGFVVSEGDTRAMADRIVHLSSNSVERIRMGDAARHRVLERFTWDREQADLIQVLGLGPNETALLSSSSMSKSTPFFEKTFARLADRFTTVRTV